MGYLRKSSRRRRLQEKRDWWNHHPYLRRPVRVVAVWIYKHLGTQWGGGPRPPTDQRTVHLMGEVERVLQVGNDGFELWIGYPDKWQLFLSRKEARALARFILGWMMADWFGLRRSLWYWGLSTRLATEPPVRPQATSVLLENVGPKDKS